MGVLGWRAPSRDPRPLWLILSTSPCGPALVCQPRLLTWPGPRRRPRPGQSGSGAKRVPRYGRHSPGPTLEVSSLQQQENTKDHQLYFRTRGSLPRWISKNRITSGRLLPNLRLIQHQGPDGGPPQRPVGGWRLARPRRPAVSPTVTALTASHQVDLPGHNFAAAAPPPPPLRAPTAPPRPCLTRPRVRPPALTFIGPHLHAHPPSPQLTR